MAIPQHLTEVRGIVRPVVSEAVAAALSKLEGNPYASDRETFAAACERVRRLPKSRTVMEAIEVGDIEGAERRLLAIGHADVLAGETELLEMPKRIWEKLPRTRDDYLRVIAAAGRCHAKLETLAGESDAMRGVRRETWAACFGESLHIALVLHRVIHDHDVLILGETGTGKEAIATAIQEGLVGATAKRAPSNALNAASVPETLIASELFGHVKGAFTGATVERKGRIRTAKGGSFFLDEVGDLSLTTQVKLLRVMETNVVSPLGADQGFVADVRYIAATHKDLARMVDDGEFRRDLYERLAGHVIEIPPLRDRREDIPAMGMAFVVRHLPDGVADGVRERVEKWLRKASKRAYSWPGNVRELQNKLRSAILGFEPEVAHVPLKTAEAADVPGTILDGSATMRELSDWYLQKVLLLVDHNYAAAARILGVDRATIRRRAQKLGSKD